jgi:hypothetical protein
VIPEVGDLVMVNFRYGQPDQPFVVGSMHTGTKASGGGPGNNIKSLSSKSGNKLELNDKEGSVYLTDHGGVNMKFDGGGNATTNANSNHTVNAGSTNVINVGAKENTPPQSLLKMDAAGNIVLDGKTSITFQVGGNKIVISKEGVVITAAEGKIEGIAETGEITIKSMTSNVTVESAGANASIKGSIETNLGGGSVTNLTGGTVNINEI